MKTRHPLPAPAGFTLLEALVSLAIFSIIATVAARSFIWSLRMTTSGNAQINYISEARLAQEKITAYVNRGNLLQGLSTTATALRIQVDYGADRAFEEAEIRYEDRGAGKRNKVLVYDPDRNNAVVVGQEVVICRYVSPLGGTPYFRVISEGQYAGSAEIRFRVGDSVAADQDMGAESGPGFQGVDVRFSAAPKDLQENAIYDALGRRVR